MTHRILAVFIGLTLLLAAAQAQEIDWKNFDPKKATPEEMERVNAYLEGRLKAAFAKTTGDPREIRSLIIRGNKITTVVYNYGNITRPNTLGNVADLVWNNLGYGFEFTPLVGGEVVDIKGDTVHILDDGMWLSTQGGYAPDGSIKWGWLPKAGYAAPGQSDIAAWSARSDVGGDLTRRPHSWPESWYNAALGRYVWPAFLGNDATSPDEEVYFVCDDWTNAKYQYYPFPEDSTKRGLGLDLECRFFQFNNPLAEDIIFLVYRVTNKSPKEISKVYFGMYGDPHIGGYNDYGDDLAFFIPPRGTLAEPYPQRARSMVYAWDPDGVGMSSLPTGYFGFKFLESPSNALNLKDDDDDGIVDESPFNDAGVYIDGVVLPLTTGIIDTVKYSRLYGKLKPRWSGDENGNWDPLTDDAGLDGLPGTGDFGEGNGKPDIGFGTDGNLTAEPNFGIRDVNESDQIGLTSFYALPYTNSTPNVPKNDILFWQLLSSDSIAIDQTLFSTPSDNIFLYGSGPFALPQGGTQRFSVALLMGTDLADLVLNSGTAQTILEANYRFAAPPPKPNVSVVPGDKRVTLYWDKIAESSIDPLTRVNDFEGYKIYRSADPTFSDVFTITDANGTPFLGKPFQQGGKLAQFDLVNEWSGLHPVEYEGRGVKFQLGSNSGLVHEYVDSSVVNGKEYYYAVVSYDHGSTLLDAQFAPSESQASIKQDPITRVFTFDVNTCAVTPGPPAAGIARATSSGNTNLASRIAGASTGPVFVKVLDPRVVPDRTTYFVDFLNGDSGLVYNAYPQERFSETFTSRDTINVPLTKRDIFTDSVVVIDANGSVVSPTRYSVSGARGLIRGTTTGALPKDAQFTIRYKYFVTYLSSRLDNEDDNPVFDGMKVYVLDQPLGLDTLGTPTSSGWRVKAATNLVGKVQKSTALPNSPLRPAPIDLQIVWNKTDTTARGKWLYPGDTLLNNSNRKLVVCPFRIINVTDTTRPRILVNGAVSDSIWRPGREIVIVTPPKYSPSQSPIPVHAAVMFTAPAGQGLILPTQGDIFEANTTKPFAAGDRYAFTTTASKFDPEGKASSILDRISVVPNPYVAYSNLESTGADATKRGDYRLQFRNLPPKCTIRIYTMVGELVDTIEKDDNTSMATWNLLSYEGQRIAYGVYLYHVDAPGVGEKVGRFAVIK
jgi:hypothetical protein